MWDDDDSVAEDIDLIALITRERPGSAPRTLLEVARLWGDAWLDLRGYAPGADVVVGGSAVRWDGARAFVRVGGEEVEVADRAVVVEAEGLVYVVQRAAPAEIVEAAWPVDRGGLASGAAAAAAMCVTATALQAGPSAPPSREVELPERYVEWLREEVPVHANPDAGEGARAKREVGKIGKKDARMERFKGDKVKLQKSEIDRRVVEQAGLMGATSDDAPSRRLGASGLSAEIQGGIGGLIGTRGSSLGSGTFGARGSGLGGGGTAEGLGGLGTKGLGSGASGYGSGGGAFAMGSYVEDAVSYAKYADYGTNQMVLADTDPLSTFAIDVDTGSFTNARRMIEAGSRPPKAAVRVEEFVNYPDYDYADPVGDAPIGVSLEAGPSPWAHGRHLLRVGLRAKAPGGERKPAHLVFLVDVSGSMGTLDRLPLAQQSLTWLVDHLGPEDTVGIVTYAGAVREVLQPTPTTRRSEILRGIDSLSAGGSTAMGSGLELAYRMASDAFVEGIENRVIVLSDGDANVGNTSHGAILAQIEKYARKGITLSTIGFGTGNYNDALMEQLADEGDGNYFYVDSLEEGQRIFGEKLVSTIETVARDVKVQVEFDPDAVYGYRLIGYENRDVADEDFRDDRVDAGEVGAGHTVTALYELVLKDEPSGDLATVRIRAEKPGRDGVAREWTTPLPVRLVRDELPDTTRDFRVAVGMAAFAEVLRGSAPEVDLKDVSALIRGAERYGSEDAALADLVDRAASLTAYDRSVGGVSLTSAQPVILGALDGQVIDEVVRRHANQLRYCYQRELVKDGSLAGKVTIKFVIAKDGTVSSASTKSSTLGSTAVEGCVEGRFLRMQFPKPKGGGIVIVSWPLAFSPA